MDNLFVSEEIATKLKVKGFNEPCLGFYFSGLFYFNDGMDDGAEESDLSINSEILNNFTAAPLYAQVVDWFEGKNINIYALKSYGTWRWKLDGGSGNIGFQVGEGYATKSEALIKGIDEALKLI